MEPSATETGHQDPPVPPWHLRFDRLVGRPAVAAGLLLLLFVYRLGFGLTSEFWFIDELQIYLIGLKTYTAGQWPFFGPDLVLKGIERFHQIPGALQGLLVGLPFYVVPVPEAPFVLLNLLSFAALAFLAWYGQRRVPQLPRFLVFGLALTLPWTLHYSTHIVNPSYVLFGAALFWIGAVEAIVFPTNPVLPRRSADYLQGFGLLWILQLHMSWTLLVPIAGIALGLRLWRDRRDGLRALVAFALGCATTGSLLLPTLLKYGLSTSGNAGIAIRFNPINARDFVSILAKTLSFASYELPRFIGPSNRVRLAWLNDNPVVMPFAYLVVAVGLVQPLLMIAMWFRKRVSAPGWTEMKTLTAGTIILTWGAFLVTLREPWALTFYLTLPLAFLYSLFCYGHFVRGGKWLAFAALILLSGLVTNTALAKRSLDARSLYLNRDLVVKAIAERNHEILAIRRPGTFF